MSSANHSVVAFINALHKPTHGQAHQHFIIDRVVEYKVLLAVNHYWRVGFPSVAIDSSPLIEQRISHG